MKKKNIKLKKVIFIMFITRDINNYLHVCLCYCYS